MLLTGEPGAGQTQPAKTSRPGPLGARPPRSAPFRSADLLGGQDAADVIFEGDDLSNVRGFVAAGLGVAVVPAVSE